MKSVKVQLSFGDAAIETASVRIVVQASVWRNAMLMAWSLAQVGSSESLAEEE